VTVGEIHGDRYPLPVFLRDCLGLSREFFGNETIEQGGILKPTAIIVLKEVALDGTACLLVRINPNEASTTIRRADSIFRQRSPNLVRLIMAGAAGTLPDLLLSRVVPVAKSARTSHSRSAPREVEHHTASQ
jgi:hypothetical protein